MVDDRVYGKDNHVDETMEFHDNIMITPVRIIGILLLLAGVLLLLFQLDDGVFFLLIQLYDVMSPGFVSPALIEELLTTSSRHITSYQKSTDVIYPNVSVLPGLLLQVVLVVHGVVDH